MLVSLLTACDEIPGLASWTASVRAEPDVLPLMPAAVSDNAASIVTDWSERLRQRFRERGTELRPRAGGDCHARVETAAHGYRE
jgi:hypothetical protein